MDTTSHPLIEQLAGALPDELPLTDAESAGRRAAAVAALLRPYDEAELELLLIRRADRAGDIWSGHIALPGGRAELDDTDIVHTAMRETMEEVGIDLAEPAATLLLGALPPLVPRIDQAPQLTVQPFVWAVSAGSVVRPNEEVADHTWITLEQLRHPDRQVRHRYVAPDGSEHELPGVQIGADVLWGITLRIVNTLLEIA